MVQRILRCYNKLNNNNLYIYRGIVLVSMNAKRYMLCNEEYIKKLKYSNQILDQLIVKYLKQKKNKKMKIE